MKDIEVNNYREKFEEVMRSKDFTDEDLDYFYLSEEEQITHPLRGDFLNYKKKEVQLLFVVFVEGAKMEGNRLDWLYKNGLDVLSKNKVFGKYLSFINFRHAIDNQINKERVL